MDNARRLRLTQQYWDEFIVGSMNNLILDSLEARDLELFTCKLTTVHLQPRSTHAALV